MIILGASGRTGMLVHQLAVQKGYCCFCPSHADLSLEDADAYVLSHPEAVAVINCAAISGIEACLDDAFTAHCVNALCPAQIALACRHTGARFIHLSTDYVLDGRRSGLKNESSKCRPVCTYAMSKWEGEQQVMEAYDQSIIARVSWVCGNPAKPAFVEQICAKALAGEALAAIDDKLSLPTHAADIARVCLQLVSRPELRGVVHLCSSAAQGLSWWDCAQLALDELYQRGALSALPELTCQKLNEISFFRDERPRYTAMNNQKLTQQWGIEMPTAEDTIRQAVAGFQGQL